jgi:hypothetical protein
MNVETGSEATQFLFWEYLFQIFGIVYLQLLFFCTVRHDLPSRNCCMVCENERMGKKEAIAFITLVRSRITFENLAKEVKKLKLQENQDGFP